MKNILTFSLSFLLISVSLGQDIVNQQYSLLENKKFSLSDNDKFDFKSIGYTNSRDINKTVIVSDFNAKQKLDSLILKMFYESTNTWTLVNKYDFLYDENGNTTILIENSWDTDLNIWIPQIKAEQLFNELNKPFQLIINSWETDSNQWISYEKHDYEYEENGSLKMEIFIEKDYTNNWVNKWKTDYTYDIDFGIQSELYSTWVIDSNMFIPNRMYEFIYDPFGYLETVTEKRWVQNTMTWKDYSKAYHTYNTNNQDSTMVFLKLDYATDSLINWSKMEYYYDSNDFDKIDIHYYWDKSLNQWGYESKQETNYNNNDKNTLLIRSLWYNDSIKWHHVNKNEFTYDYNENLSSFQIYIPTNSVDWLLFAEHVYNYDYNYMISECFFPPLASYPPEYYDHMYNKPTDYEIYSVDNGVFYDAFKMIFHYSELNIGISEAENMEIEVYPNPTTGQLMINNENEIKLKEIIIYNQIGQKVLNYNVIPNIIDLSALNQGIYIIEFVTENSMIRKKIILKE